MKNKNLSECQKIRIAIKSVLPANWGVKVYSNGTYYVAKMFIEFKNNIRLFLYTGKISIPIFRIFSEKDWQNEALKVVESITKNHNEVKDTL